MAGRTDDDRLHEMRTRALVPLPSQPAGVPWPTRAWPRAEPPAEVGAALTGLLDDVTSDVGRYGTTYAVAVVHRGSLLAERYGGELEHWDGPNEPVGPATGLLSWSMAKSVLHAVVGMLVADGRLDLDAPAPVPEWATRIQPAVQSAILANPDLNYILPIYDSMSQFVVPAITITNARDRVKIATFNGTPFVLRMVQDGQVEMNIGENLDWIGRAIIDAEMRGLCGLELVKDPHIPLYIFDSSNVHTAGKPPMPSIGYGMDYIVEYEKLWGLR